MPQKTAWTSTTARALSPLRTSGATASTLVQGGPTLTSAGVFYTTRDPEQAATWAAGHYGESGTVLHYSVPSRMFDSLSGQVFQEADSDLDMVYSMRSGGSMHSYDYVEGPLLGDPGGFLAGKEPITFGNQVSFHTETAVNLLNGYLQP